MQLSRLTLGLASLVLASSLARADNRATFQLDYFTEPARSQRLNVIMPSVGTNVDVHPNVSVNLGYTADIVTGATPRVYGSSVDAVSSATKFKDIRHAPHAGMQFRIGPTTLDVGYAFSTENDYRSHQLNVGAKVDLWGKNTTLVLGYSHNWDQVCDVDNKGAQPLERQALATSKGCFDDKAMGLIQEALAIDSYAISWTQVITPILLSDLSVGLQVIDGFQSNPYRRVRLFNGSDSWASTVPLNRRTRR